MADLKRRIIAEISAKNKAKGELASFQRDMEKTGQAMKRMAMGALSMVGAGGGIYALKRGFDYVTKAAMKQEDAVFLLEAALKAAGEYSSEAMEGFEAFAASIQKATIYGDEEVLALMQLMKSLGVTSDALEQATRMAIGLAAATGRDVKSMSMYIALAQQGEFTMLRRYIPALRRTTDATEQLRIITEFSARGFKIAEAQAETTSGSITKMWNAISDLAEVAGKPILEPMAKNAGALTILMAGATAEIKKLQKAAEAAEKLRPKPEVRPGGFPRIPITTPFGPDLEERFKGRLKLPTPPIPEVMLFPSELMDNIYELADAEEKASAKMCEMMMKARGLGDELARQKLITEYTALATTAYSTNVAGAQAAVERFKKAFEGVEEVKRQEAANKAIIDATRERINAVRHMDYATRMERIQNLKAYVAANKEALEQVLEANKLLQDELKALELSKLYELRRWGRDAVNVWMQIDQIAVKSLDSMADALTELCLTGKADFKALALSVITDITRMMIKMQMAQALGIGGAGPGIGTYVMAGVGALFGAPGAGAPGGPPTTAGVQQYALGGYGGGLQHGGEVLKTGLAMVHRGEKYSGVGGGGGGVTINVNSVPETYEISEAEEYMLGDERIINVFMQKIQTHGPLRRSIKQIR